MSSDLGMYSDHLVPRVPELVTTKRVCVWRASATADGELCGMQTHKKGRCMNLKETCPHHKGPANRLKVEFDRPVAAIKVPHQAPASSPGQVSSCLVIPTRSRPSERCGYTGTRGGRPCSNDKDSCPHHQEPHPGLPSVSLAADVLAIVHVAAVACQPHERQLLHAAKTVRDDDPDEAMRGRKLHGAQQQERCGMQTTRGPTCSRPKASCNYHRHRNKVAPVLSSPSSLGLFSHTGSGPCLPAASGVPPAVTTKDAGVFVQAAAMVQGATDAAQGSHSSDLLGRVMSQRKVLTKVPSRQHN